MAAVFLLLTPPSPFLFVSPRPLVCFPPTEMFHLTFSGDDFQVVVTKKAAQVDAWISLITKIYSNRPRVLVGLDIEWLPNLSPGDDHPAATLQLCVGNRCLIFQILHADGIPDSLRQFLEDDRYIFSGVGVDDDAEKLYRDHGLRVNTAIDVNELMSVASDGHIHHMGLKKMCSIVLGEEMMKPREVTLSKWDAYRLNMKQIEYAAIDAIVSFQIAMKLYACIARCDEMSRF